MLRLETSADPDSGRLVPTRLIAPAVALAAVAAALLALLALRLAHTSGPGRLDSAIDQRLIARTERGHELAAAIAQLGGPWVMVPLVAVTAAVMMLIGRRRAALLVLIAPAAASALTEWVLKPLVQRVFLSARTHGLAFPSGHSTATFSLAFAIAAVALAHRHPRRPTGGQWAIAMAAVGVAVSVALALVIARWHYPTDTVGGALVALCTVIAVALGIDTALRAHPAARGIRGQ